jgi:molybdate transport system ATP-binding protein
VNGAGLDARLQLRRGESFHLDLSLSIEPGTTVALLGPNAAGKSTAVAALAGLLPLDSGLITLSGLTLDDPERDIFVVPEERKVGVVFQDYLLFPHLSVAENIAFGLRSRRVSREESLARAGKWIDRLGLAGLAGSKPGSLSGGQAQRVALARALVTEPDLLLLDEPLSALDVTTRVELRRTVAEHLETFPGPRLLITHDPTEAFLLADEIHVIEQGAVTQAGTADDIRLRPRTPYVADLAGVNLIPGIADDGVVDTGSHLLRIADHGVSGAVMTTIRPSAISVHLQEPAGSPRNSWKTEIGLIERLGERVRLRTGGPLALTVEITEDASRALALSKGAEVWVSVKATEIGIEADYS